MNSVDFPPPDPETVCRMELPEQELAGDLPHRVHLEQGRGGQQNLQQRHPLFQKYVFRRDINFTEFEVLAEFRWTSMLEPQVVLM